MLPSPNLALLVLACGLAPGAGAARASQVDGPQAEEPLEARSFAIPETRTAKELYRLAREHRRARRWPEALHALQRLSQEHRGELLGVAFDVDGQRSQMPVHVGAAEAARRMLLELPAAARAAYRERYGPDARAALDAARQRLDRAALVEVTRRWPLTAAAVEAWWTLGDLEFELGNAHGAARIWQRAARLSEHLGQSIAPGIERRLRLAGELSAGDDGDLQALARSSSGAYLRAPPTADADNEPPSPQCYSWRVEIDVDGQSPFNGQRGSPDLYNMFPVLVGDTVLVSTSLRLLAVDAYAGNLRWISDEPPGWDAVDAGTMESLSSRRDKSKLSRRDFMSGLDRETLLVAPAAGSGIAVAALQIPVTHFSNREFQSIRITTVIPDRRLFAYDLATGRPLWNHMPPPLWDGESGSFPQRMRVAGPPVVVGSRVLVPAYRMRGRIDYHVACYDLATGELLWSRAIISGQRELNMFGRHRWEFCAPPLLVEGDRVIALTGLGAVAAVDLYTGDLLWETLYEQIALPQVHQFEAHRRKRHWRNAPPAAVDGVVVATPVDSEDLIALDLESGAALWSIRYDTLMRGRPREQLSLIGATKTRVYLAGRKILTRQQPAGLASRQPPDKTDESDLLYDAGESKFGALPWPTLTADHIVVPTKSKRIVLDRRNPSYEDPRLLMSWRDQQMAGNVLVEGSVQLCLTGRYLTGYFDWDDLQQRFETKLERSPKSADAIAAYASILANRGLERLRGRNAEEALRTLARARELLEPLVAPDDGADAAPAAVVLERLHYVLRHESAAYVQLVDFRRALQRLRRARELAPDRFALRDTLLIELELLEQRSLWDDWLKALDELEAHCGDMLWRSPHLFDSDADAEPDEERESLAVGLWVLLRRQELFRREHRRGDELEVLHAILADYGETELSASAGARSGNSVAERIGVLIRAGATGEYAPFEERAGALLERALEADDLEQLARVPALFPHSQAAQRANDARIAAAFERGDVATLAEVALRELPAQWHPRTASPRQIELLLRLASVLAHNGNPAYRAGLLASLAEHHPHVRSTLVRHDGRTLAQLAADFAPEPPAPEAAAEFDESARLVASSSEAYTFIDTVSDADGAPLSLYASPTGFTAFTTAGETAWKYETSFQRGSPNWGGRRYGELGRLTAMVGNGGLVGLDTTDGRELWTWEPESGHIANVGGQDGVATVFVSSRELQLLLGIDTASGVVLWSRPVEHEGWMWSLCGAGRVVILPHAFGATETTVVDLFTGRERARFDLPRNVKSPNHRSAWIERGRLIVPLFGSWRGEHHYLAAYDLDDGTRAWHVPEDDGLELDSIVHCDGRTYLLLLGSHERVGGLLEVHTRDGSVRSVPGVEFEMGDVPIGLARNDTAELAAPLLFAASRDAGDWLRIRAIHLPYGERWAHRVLVPKLGESTNSMQMPYPALSRTTVALAFTEPTEGPGKRGTTQLLFLDRSSGVRREARVLAPELGEARELELTAAGDALFLAGGRALHVTKVNR